MRVCLTLANWKEEEKEGDTGKGCANGECLLLPPTSEGKEGGRERPAKYNFFASFRLLSRVSIPIRLSADCCHVWGGGGGGGRLKWRAELEWQGRNSIVKLGEEEETKEWWWWMEEEVGRVKKGCKVQN